MYIARAWIDIECCSHQRLRYIQILWCSELILWSWTSCLYCLQRCWLHKWKELRHFKWHFRWTFPTQWNNCKTNLLLGEDISIVQVIRRMGRSLWIRNSHESRFRRRDGNVCQNKHRDWLLLIVWNLRRVIHFRHHFQQRR